MPYCNLVLIQARCAALAAILATAWIAGCATPQQQISAVVAEKEQLLATIEQQKAELTTLRERSAKLEARLATSEKQIARRDPAASIRPDAAASEPGLAWRTHEPPTDAKNSQRR